MKFVSVREFRNQPKQVWKKLAREKDIVVTNNGRPIGIMTEAAEDQIEETLDMMRQIRAMRAVHDMRMTSLRLGNDKMTMDQIDAEIQAVRKQRK